MSKSNHSDQVWVVAFRPPGGEGVRAVWLASASNDKSISLYQLRCVAAALARLGVVGFCYGDMVASKLAE